MKKYYILIPLGIVLLVIGSYIMSYSVKPEYFIGHSWMESQIALLETDYHIGLGLFSAGFASFVSFIAIWKRKSSQKKT